MLESLVSHNIRLFITQIYTCFATLILEWGKIVGTLSRVREEYFYRGWKTLHINNVIIFMPSVTSYLFNR